MPTLAGCTDSKLKLSVITSSSEKLEISQLLAELWVLRAFAIDFYPRGLDIQKALSIGRPELEAIPLAERFTDSSFIKELGDYIRNEKIKAASIIQDKFCVPISPEVFHVPALATFFPEITSFNDEYAEQAGKALAGSIELAVAVKAKVVEFVLGRVVERCHKPPVGYDTSGRLRCDYVYKSDAKDRIERAVDVIAEFVYPVAKNRVKLAAEIEPGFSFVLNDRSNIDCFLSELARKNLINTVGLNLDIGHAIILAGSEKQDCQITPAIARLWKQHIFHVHASDNIGFHFRDLVPGVYHYLLEKTNEPTFREWIELCMECSEENKHFSKYIAVELESTSRIQWIQRSLLRLAYVIREVCN